MSFPESLPERQVAEILEEQGVVEKPKYTFHDVLKIWRGRLLLLLPVVTTLAANVELHSLAPDYYRMENALYIGAFSVGAGIGGVVLAEVLATHFRQK